MGGKVKGPDLKTIERAALEIERYLKAVSAVEAPAAIADLFWVSPPAACGARIFRPARCLCS